MGIPLRASTQWQTAREAAGVVDPACEELIRWAAQGEMMHNDGTTMKILAFMSVSRLDARVAAGSA